MKILKSRSFTSETDLTKFVNVNKIQKDDILMITAGNTIFYTLFYYAEA